MKFQKQHTELGVPRSYIILRIRYLYYEVGISTRPCDNCNVFPAIGTCIVAGIYNRNVGLAVHAYSKYAPRMFCVSSSKIFFIFRLINTRVQGYRITPKSKKKKKKHLPDALHTYMYNIIPGMRS